MVSMRRLERQLHKQRFDIARDGRMAGVIGDDDIHFLVFFDQATPADIGYRAAASAYMPTP